MSASPDGLGRDAVYGRAVRPYKFPWGQAQRPANLGGPTWKESHRRASFYIPIKLHDELRAHARLMGRSKSRIVAEAVEMYLLSDTMRLRAAKSAPARQAAPPPDTPRR